MTVRARALYLLAIALASPLLAPSAVGQVPIYRDSAVCVGALPQAAAVSPAAAVVSEQSRQGHTFVRILQLDGLGINTAVRLFAREDSARSYLDRFLIAPGDYGRAIRQGIADRGISIDSVRTDSMSLGRMPGMYRRQGAVAHVYASDGVFTMTQAVLATTGCAVVLQIGGWNRPSAIESLIVALSAGVVATLRTAPPN